MLSGVQENQSEWLKWCLTKTYVFEWRLWEQILSRVGQVSFACSPSKVAVWVWNLTVGTLVSSLVTQGHFGQIRSGCQVAINSPPHNHKRLAAQISVHGFCRLRATHLEAFEREFLARIKALTTRARENWASLKSSCLCDLKTYYTWGLWILQPVRRRVLSIQESLWIAGERSLWRFGSLPWRLTRVIGEDWVSLAQGE